MPASDIAYRGLAGALGGPVDLTTMLLRQFGYDVPDEAVVGGSEWLGKKMEDAGLVSSARNPMAEMAASMVMPGPGELMAAGKGLAAGLGALYGATRVKAPGRGTLSMFLPLGADDAPRLAQAEKMISEGATPAEVWSGTGLTNQGGHWMKEISDADVTYRPRAALSEELEKNDLRINPRSEEHTSELQSH